MPSYAALLRAINVGGTGKLAMTELCALCESAGFRDVKTYIQSGNVVFSSKLSEAKVKAKLELLLAEKLGKPCGAMIRTSAELRAVLTNNPFPKAKPSQVVVLFLDQAPARDVLKGVVTPAHEELALGLREIFVHYPDGQGKSKLKLPLVKVGTGRNLNTVGKLVEMVEGIG